MASRGLDVVVVGGGVVGASAARSLARAGRSVAMLERVAPGHTGGSSHGGVRAFAFAHPRPDFVEMAVESHAKWRELERETGAEILAPVGALFATEDPQPFLTGLTSAGVAFELVDAEAAAARFNLSLRPCTQAIFQPDAGAIWADVALRALHWSAAAHGAKLVERCTVSELLPHEDSVEVVTAEGQRYVAGVVVVTAGVWTPTLLAQLGIDVPGTPRLATIAYFPTRNGAVAPPLYEHGDPPTFTVPTRDGLVKVGKAGHGPAVGPGDKLEPSRETLEALADFVQRRFPTASPVARRVETCVRAFAPTREFVLERHGRVVATFVCNGEGFKHAPELGDQLAALAVS